MYVIAAVAVIVLAIGGALLGRLIWARTVRGRVVSLAGRYEAIAAGERQLRAVVMHLAESSDEELFAFAQSSSHEDRHLLAEVAARLQHQTDELMGIALPKSLWSTADTLADAAWRVAREAEGATKGKTPDDVLASLGQVDLQAVCTAVAAAERAIEGLREQYGADEEVVYGGGLYI